MVCNAGRCECLSGPDPAVEQKPLILCHHFIEVLRIPQAELQVVGVILSLLESVKADVPQAFVHEALPLKRLRCPHFPVLHEHLLFLLPPFCPAAAGYRHLDPDFLLRVERNGFQVGHIDLYLPTGMAVPADEESFIVVVITVLRLICRLRLTNSTLQQAVKFTHSAHPTL